MGKGYLIDSNAVIDFLEKSLPETGHKFLAGIPPVISIVSFIEILSGKNKTEGEKKQLDIFAELSEIIYLDKNIALKAIDLRVKYRMKLPDAVIAATALSNDLILITRNVVDFDNIKGLRIVNPHDMRSV